MSRAQQLAIQGVIASQAAAPSYRTAQKASFIDANNQSAEAVWTATAPLGAANANIFIAGCFRTPTTYYSVRGWDTLTLFFQGTAWYHTRLFFQKALNVMEFAIYGNSGAPIFTTAPRFNNHATDDLNKAFYYIIGITANSSAYLYYKKETGALTAWETAAVLSSQTSLAAVDNFRFGSEYSNNYNWAGDAGPHWMRMGTNYLNGSNQNDVFDDFFGPNAHSDGVSASPRFTTSTGAFTGAASGTSYPQPPIFIDWDAHDSLAILDNKGTLSNLGVITGTPTPTYGNF